MVLRLINIHCVKYNIKQINKKMIDILLIEE